MSLKVSYPMSDYVEHITNNFKVLDKGKIIENCNHESLILIQFGSLLVVVMLITGMYGLLTLSPKLRYMLLFMLLFTMFVRY